MSRVNLRGDEIFEQLGKRSEWFAILCRPWRRYQWRRASREVREKNYLQPQVIVRDRLTLVDSVVFQVDHPNIRIGPEQEAFFVAQSDSTRFGADPEVPQVHHLRK